MTTFSDFFKKIEQAPPRKLNDHLLLLDSANTLIRNFSIVKALNREGVHIGGMTGFLKSLGYLVRIIEPTRVLCIFDGKGSTINRRSIDPGYKAQRALAKITHWGIYESKSEEKQALVDQIDRLGDYLKCLPVQIVVQNKLEADDIIAYLAKNASRAGKKVTIVSSDKDFLQLVDEHINVYSPIKKINYDLSNIQEALEVLPENYNVVKSLLGDDSDNLPGVKGIGLKTLLKLFPELNTEPGITLEYIYEQSAERMSAKKPLYAKIVDSWERVEINYKLMNLHETVLSIEEKQDIQGTLSEPIPSLQSSTFQYLLQQDKIEGITMDTGNWLQGFSELSTLYEQHLCKAEE